MKRISLIIILICAAMVSSAQEVVVRYDSRSEAHGLYNARSDRWVVSPRFSNGQYLGAYQGVHYWKVQSKETSLWGVISSDNYNKYRVSPQYNAIRINASFSSVPTLGVKKNSDWGVIEVGTQSCYILIKCQYKEIYPNQGYYFQCWNGPDVSYSLGDIKKMYEKALQSEQQAKKEAEERMLREYRERQAAAERAKKEKELSSFTLYAKQYVTPKVNEWQQKGEFEKIAEYQERVTGANREQKIRTWTKEAEEMFIKENAALNPISGLRLEKYDSESEVFSVQSPKFGQLLVPVPITEAPDFKFNFETGVHIQNPIYFIENDKIALSQVEFYNQALGKSYYYNNQLALNYKQYEIDPDALGIEAVRITSSSTTTPVAQMQKPTCEILSPAKGSTYSTPTIKLRYVANVDPRTTPIVQFYVAGKEVRPIESTGKTGKNLKGATVVRGTEVELPMPQDIGVETAVSIQVKDGFGTWAEPKTITLKYAGEKPKPTLHLLAVGVSDYPAADLQSLSYAAKDARDFVQTIGSSDLSMYKEMKPVLIVDKEANTRNLQRQLFQLTSRVAQGDVVMLFFSGHGIVQDKERYFMSYDASAEEYYNGLEFEFIRKRMTEMSENKQCRVIVFMDACHSGAMAGTKGSLQDITFATPGVIGFYSSTAGEQSAETDKMQNGVFTRVLLNGLKGGAKDKEGQVTLHTLDTYIKQNVSAQTKGKQTPIVENTTGDAVLFHIK